MNTDKVCNISKRVTRCLPVFFFFCESPGQFRDEVFSAYALRMINAYWTYDTEKFMGTSRIFLYIYAKI